MDVQGKTIAVTGKFNDISRKEIELALAQRGAKIAKSVTGKTEVLIAGERAGSKLAKAKSMGILIVSEKELLAALKEKATVVVEAPKPKTVALPQEYEGKTFPKLFKDKTVFMTGKLQTFKRAQLKKLLENSGAKVVSTPTTKTDIAVSGYKWGNKLRDAVRYDATVWSEGELLLRLEGRSDFPRPDEVPNGENLSKLEAVEEGETRINVPGDQDGELVLKWKKVEFKVHQRFLECFGFEFAGEHQWLGRLYYNGEELKPAALFADFYGSEGWRRSHFWECGSDFDDTALVYDGKHGFNCSSLSTKRKRLHVNWENRGTFWMCETNGETHWYGDVSNDCSNMWLMVDLERKTFGFNFHTAPYIIRPDNPYNR